MRTRDQIYKQMSEVAESNRKDGETQEQAFSRFMETAQGARLYREYVSADSEPKPKTFVETRVPSHAVMEIQNIEEQGRKCEAHILRQVYDKAEHYQEKHPGLTREKAVEKIFTEFPHLYDVYRKAVQIDRNISLERSLA